MNPRQPPKDRALWITLGVFAVVAFGVTTAAATVAYSYYNGGFVRIAVDDRSADPTTIHLAVPAMVLDAALALAPLAIPADAQADLRRELGDYGPMLRQLAAELERCPDAILVEVEDDTDHVRITKERNSLIIRVRSTDTDVDVQVPVSLAGHALRAIS